MKKENPTTLASLSAWDTGEDPKPATCSTGIVHLSDDGLEKIAEALNKIEKSINRLAVAVEILDEPVRR